jgi:hypothetical protein
MRELRYVKPAEDGALLLATSDGLEEFRLPVDPTLRDAVRSEPVVHRPAAPAPSGPAITPREIQVRVRAGERAEDIADNYGASLDWVLRFAGPVLDERERVADEARRARARRSTTDGQPVVFGEAVDQRFEAYGIDPGSVRWDARRREDGQWMISAHWTGGDAERVAEWTFQLSSRTVAPQDDTAADLLSDKPVRSLAPVPAPEPALSAAIAPPLMPGVVAFPAMADAHTGQLPRVEEVFDQEQYPDDDPEPPAASVDLFGAAIEDEPPLPLPIETGRHAEKPRRRVKLTDLGTGTRAESDDDKAARAHIPSWDDILLGVRRKND